MTWTPTVLVTDGDQRSSLSVVRSLGSAGYRVHVCGSRVPTLAGSSRYATEEFPLPDPLAEPELFAEGLRSLVSSWDVDVLLPMTDESLTAVLERPGLFEDVHLPFPAPETYRAVSDKRCLLETASRLGIAVPEQRVVSHRGDASEAMTMELPVVVKPARSVAGENGDLRKLKVSHAETREELSQLLDGLPEAAFPALVQRRIRGRGTGVFLLMQNGDPAAVFGHRRIREKPPAGGVSVYRESIRVEPDLVRQSVDLLREFDWEGVAMVEYKVEEGTGIPYLMEVNGRFWGSLQLAVDAGVDFPRLLVKAAAGVILPPPPEYEEGVRLRWLWGDVDHLVARIRRPDDGGGTVKNGSRLRAVGEIVGSWRPGERWETLRLSDPRPFLRETVDWWRAL